jgi:ElaB/YqjD/DUF883 family membrane-anchored ribosome-binding protein
MNENQPQGGAAASLGAHSKDSPAGPSDRNEGASAAWEAAAGVADQAREGMERVKSTVRDAAETARDNISTRGGQAMDSTEQMVRDQPLIALAVTGIACFAIGMMVGRSRD